MTPELEIEIPIDAELEIEVPEPVAAVPVAPERTLVEVLAADVPLPMLIKFVPDLRFKIAVQEAVDRAQSVNVTGSEGLAEADLALTDLRDAVKNALEHFREPVEIANGLHKWMTTRRAEWTGSGPETVTALGRRMFEEQRRLQKIADDAARREQEIADQAQKDAAAKEAKAAESAGAPQVVVEQLREQAKTATAAPVTKVPAALKLSGSAIVATFKARIKGTPGHADPNPQIGELTVEQVEQVRVLLTAIINGTAPMSAISLNWSYLNARAKADKKTFSIAGMEYFEDGGARGKARR